MTGQVGLLVLFDDAVPLVENGLRPAALPQGITRLLCLGYPTLAHSSRTLAAVSRLLGVPVDRWPETLDAASISAVLQALTDRSRQMDEDIPARARQFPWPRLKANDRVINRMRPLGTIEALLSRAFAAGTSSELVLPWVGDRFDLVERSGMLGLDAPGHQFTASLERLRAAHSFDLHLLWPQMAAREPARIRRSRALMASARLTLLAGRRLRDVVRPRPVGPVATTRARPALGVIVGGTSHWMSLQPLVQAASARYDVVAISQDIFRNPSAYKTLRQAGQPFVPVDALLSVAATAGVLRSAFQEQRKIVRDARRRARAMASCVEQEHVLLPTADVAAMPELRLFTEQVRSAIRRFTLSALVSANNVDSLLGAATHAAHAEGIPHVCIHNTALESVPLPAYADCDLYVTGSESYAAYLRGQHPIGAVEALGLPLYDELLNSSGRRGHGAIFERYPHLKGRRIVGVTTQTEWIDFRPLLEALVTWAERRGDVGVVIKLHPREGEGAYADLVARLEASGSGGRLHHVPLPDFLADCDCLIAGSSTSLFWSILMGVRPFSWSEPNIEHLALRLDYLDASITTRSDQPAVLINEMERAFEDEGRAATWRASRAHYLSQCLTGADGHACERILARVEALIAARHGRPQCISA